MEDSVSLWVTDAEITLVGLTFDQICGGGFVDDDVGNPQSAGNLPDLGLEEVSEGIDRRSIICVPSVVAEEAFGLVSSSNRNPADLGRLVEEDDHSRAGTDVAEALRRDPVFVLGNISVNHSGDLDSSDLDAEVVDHELRVVEAFLAANFVGHSEGEGVFVSECACAEIGDHGGIYSAGESENDFVHASSLDDFGFKELNEPIGNLFRIDTERIVIKFGEIGSANHVERHRRSLQSS